MTSFKREKNHVQLLIKDLFQNQDRLYIRYVVLNSTKRVYETGKPEVFCLTAPRGPRNILEQRDSQFIPRSSNFFGGSSCHPAGLPLRPHWRRGVRCLRPVLAGQFRPGRLVNQCRDSRRPKPHRRAGLRLDFCLRGGYAKRATSRTSPIASGCRSYCRLHRHRPRGVRLVHRS